MEPDKIDTYKRYERECPDCGFDLIIKKDKLICTNGECNFKIKKKKYEQIFRQGWNYSIEWLKRVIDKEYLEEEEGE